MAVKTSVWISFVPGAGSIFKFEISKTAKWPTWDSGRRKSGLSFLARLVLVLVRGDEADNDGRTRVIEDGGGVELSVSLVPDWSLAL